MLIIAEIEACMMKNAIAADKAATSFSFFAIPMATPIANIIGKFANTMSPAWLNTCKRAFKIVPSPKIPDKPYALIIVSFVNDPPTPNNNPATGKIAIGNIKDLPTRCKTPKILSFISFLLKCYYKQISSVYALGMPFLFPVLYFISNTKKAGID